ncbi:MAG: hypothetical protein WDA03_11830 [Trueperaceae bacterium]
MQPLTVGIDIRGGNNDHNFFYERLELTLTNTTVEITGEISYVDLVPTRLAIREGNVWKHHQTPGPIIAQYPLEGEMDQPVDLSGSLELTSSQADKLREGLLYVEIDTNFAALGAINPTDERLAEGGQIQLIVEGLPPGEVAWVRLLTDYYHPNGGPGAFVGASGELLTGLMHGTYTAEPPVYTSELQDHVGVVTPASVQITDGELVTITVLFTGVPDLP